MRVISFQRVSTDGQDLHRQEYQAIKYCNENGYELIGTIKGKISGNTTTDDNALRKELLSLTSDVCDLVAVSELSRITREEKTYYRIIEYIDTIKRNGIDIVFLDEPNKIYRHNDGFTLVELITLLCKAEGAARELDNIRRRTITGKKDKASQFPYIYLGGTVPMGFKKIDNNDYIPCRTPKSIIAIDEEQAEIVREMYSMIIKGNSCGGVSKYLATLGIHRNQADIAYTLKNPIYKGIRTIQGVTHRIEAIVSEEVFDTANRYIKRDTANNKAHYNPLKGVLYCGCGLPITIDTGRYVCTYKHYKRRHNVMECHNDSLGIDWAIYIVKEAIKANNTLDVQLANTKSTIEQLEAKIENISKSISSLMDNKMELVNSIQVYTDKLVKVDDEVIADAIYTKMEKLSSDIKFINRDIADNDNLRKSLNTQVKELRSTLDDNDVDSMNEYQLSEYIHKAIDKIVWTSGLKKGKLDIYFKNGQVWHLVEVPSRMTQEAVDTLMCNMAKIHEYIDNSIKTVHIGCSHLCDINIMKIQ